MANDNIDNKVQSDKVYLVGTDENFTQEKINFCKDVIVTVFKNQWGSVTTELVPDIKSTFSPITCRKINFFLGSLFEFFIENETNKLPRDLFSLGDGVSESSRRRCRIPGQGSPHRLAQ